MPKPLFPLSLTLLPLLVGGVVSSAVFAAPPVPAPKPAPPKGTVAVDPQAGQKLFRQAIKQTEDGLTIAAEDTYRKLLKMFPQAGAAWANLGLLEAHNHRLPEAETDLLKAVKFEPKTAAFWAQLSRVQLERGRPKEAEASARKAVTLTPKDKFSVGNLATALLQQNRYADAIAPLKTLRTIDAENQQVTFSLVYALSRSNRKREALVYAQKLLAQNPDQAKLQLMVADLASQTGDKALAQKAYAVASKLSPKDTRTGINAAIASEIAGHPLESKNQLEKIIASHPDDPLAHFQLGRLYYLYPKLVDKPSPENFRKAEASFREAMVLDPKNPLYLGNLGLSMMFQGPSRFGDAGKILNATLSVAPQNTVARMGLGYLSEQSQDRNGAIKQYQAILAYAPRTDDARRRLAKLLYAAGKKDLAFKEFQTLAARATGASRVTAIKDLAGMKSDSQDWQGARKEYEQILTLSPKDTDALVGLGKSLEQLKQTDAAQKEYQAAIAADPKNTDAYEALGTSLLNQRKTAEATAHYQKFTAAFPNNNAAHWQLAQIYKDQKRDDDALQEMRKLTLGKTDPTRISYLLAPANLLMDRQRYSEAAGDLTQLAAENRGVEESREIRYVLANAQEKAGQKDEAEKTLTVLAGEAKDKETRLRAQTAVAALYERTNRLEDAADSYKEVISADPSSTVARVGLRRVYETLKKPQAAAEYLESMALAPKDGPDLEAASAVAQYYIEDNTREKYLGFAQRAAAKYPKNTDALKMYAQALLQNNSGDPKPQVRRQIADLYRQATTIDPKDADSFYRIGMQREALGEKNEAVNAYKSAALAEETAANTQSVQRSKSALTRLGVSLPAPAPKHIETPPASSSKK